MKATTAYIHEHQHETTYHRRSSFGSYGSTLQRESAFSPSHSLFATSAISFSFNYPLFTKNRETAGKSQRNRREIAEELQRDCRELVEDRAMSWKSIEVVYLRTQSITVLSPPLPAPELLPLPPLDLLKHLDDVRVSFMNAEVRIETVLCDYC